MDELIADIGARQHGVISRAQARADGLTRGAIKHRIDTGRWLEITPRVYRLAGAPMTDRAWIMATVLSAGADGVSTSNTALAQHRIRDFRVFPVRVVAARRPHALALDGVSETFWLPESHRTIVDGIPTATVARALFDLAATVEPADWSAASTPPLLRAECPYRNSSRSSATSLSAAVPVRAVSGES